MSYRATPAGAWPLLGGWISANAIGWAAGLAAGGLFTLAVSRLSWLNEDRVLVDATVICLGLALGAAQWVVMRRYVPRPGRWVAATLIGYLLCLLIFAGGNLARLAGPGVWDDVLLSALLGAAIGAPQWWILRRCYRGAGLWVLGTAAGFLWIVWAIVDPSHSLGELVIRCTIIGALGAAVTGAVLVWLVHRPRLVASPA
jgi:hypothetical protein